MFFNRAERERRTAVLGRKRDFAGAEEHRSIAARGTDPAAKASARELLQKLGRR